MKYEISVWLSYANSTKDINRLIGYGFAVYCREVNTQCISATKKIENRKVLLQDEDNIYIIGETRRYECFYNGNSDEEAEKIMDYLRERRKAKLSPILSYRVSFSKNDKDRISY